MIRQRLLYVGIGGSGLDLGIALDEALRREICGLDGRALRQKSVVFADFKPNQLPDFIQSVYIDFAAEALTSVTNAIKGGNARAAGNIIPKVPSYQICAEQLRTDAHGYVETWLPPRAESGSRIPTEPLVSPLSAGAGQFPTVGRAALFHSLKKTGYKSALGDTLQSAVDGLGNSMGQLTAYAGGEGRQEIAVYVGFSMSGGTGCGLFLDVLYLLQHELRNVFANNMVVVVPVVMMPSTFTNLPGDRQELAWLNAAQGLLDIADLMEHLHQNDMSQQANFELSYPDPLLGSIPATSVRDGHHIPAVALVSRAGDMSRQDVSRSVASAIVAHISSVSSATEAPGGPTNNKTFCEEMVDVAANAGSRRHKLRVGTHPFMPMMASSLIMPSRRIADILSKWVISDGLEKITSDIALGAAPVTSGDVDQLLSFCGFGDFVAPNTYQDKTNLSFLPPASLRSRDQLEQAARKVKSACASADPVVNGLMDAALTRLTNFSVTAGIIKMLEAHPERSLHHILLVADEMIRQLNSVNVVPVDASGQTRRPARKSRARLGIRIELPKRLTPAEINEKFTRLEREYREEIRQRWWSKWRALSHLSVQSIRNAQDEISGLRAEMENMKARAVSERQADISELALNRAGVVNFVPTRGLEMSAALRAMYEETVDSIRVSLGLDDRSSGVLLSKVVAGSEEGIGWADLVERHSKKQKSESLFEALLDPVRNQVERAMLGDENRGGTLPSLATLLAAVASGEGGDDVKALEAALGDLLPASLVPPGDSGYGEVQVSYPGLKSDSVEALLSRKLRLNATYATLMDKGLTDRGNRDENFTPTGDSDHITVTINKPTQGLLDVPEIRQILAKWVTELDNPNKNKLLWRQRLGFGRIDEVFSAASARSLMELIVLGMASGFVTITQGTIEKPEVLEFHFKVDKGLSSSSEVAIKIEPFDELSSWPNVPKAVVRYLVGDEQVNNLRLSVLAQIFDEITTDTRRSDVSVRLPEQVVSLMALVPVEIRRVRQELAQTDKHNDQMLRRLKSAEFFWSETLGAVAKQPYGKWKSLEVATKEALKGKQPPTGDGDLSGSEEARPRGGTSGAPSRSRPAKRVAKRTPPKKK